MKKLITVLMLICCMVFGISASASDDVKITAGLNVSDFGIDLNVTGLTPEGRITIFAREADESIVSALEGTGAVFAFVAYSDKNGSYTNHISFIPGTSSGEYIISVSDDAKSMVYESASFTYRTSEDMAEAIKAINKASSSLMAGTIDANNELLLLDNEYYGNLNNADKDSVGKMLYDIRPSKGFSDAYELHKAFNSCVAAVVITNTDYPQDVIRKYADDLGIDILLMDECNADEVNEAIKVLQMNTYSVPSELTEAYPEAVFAGKVNAASTAGEIRDLFLEDYSEQLKLDLKEYNKLSNPSKVFAEIKKLKISGFDDAKDKFYDAVKKQADSEKSKTGSGSSGGGGGGGYPVVPSENTTTPDYGKDLVSESVFADVDMSHWAKNYVEYLYSKGVVSGDGSGNYRPENTVTRAEFIKMITLAFGFEPAKSTSVFADVSDSAWYAPYVAAGTQAGIINGIGNGFFAPDSAITRQDLALICYRAAKLKGIHTENKNNGVPADSKLISDYASEAVNALYTSGIISGDPDGSFRPVENATRAEVAKIVASLMKTGEVQE